MMYYALQSNGDLFILGDHGDIESAEETAQDVGLEVVWLADQETIEQWRAMIDRGDIEIRIAEDAKADKHWEN